jgi:hypothetical protein
MQFRRSVTAACTLRGLTRALLVPQRIVKADQETAAQAGRARAAERRSGRGTPRRLVKATFLDAHHILPWRAALAWTSESTGGSPMKRIATLAALAILALILSV